MTKLAILIFLIFSATPREVRAQSADCAFDREVNGVTIRERIERLPPDDPGQPDYTQFTCQRVQGSASSYGSVCVTGGCPDYSDSNVLCCAPGTGGPPAAQETPTSAGAQERGGAGRLLLPDCINEGNCGLDDIVRTGVNFANFIFGISGAIFLAIFVYSGVEYLIFAQSSSKVQAAKKRLVDAAIGMGFIIAAGVFVSFFYNAFMGSGRSAPASEQEQSRTR